MLKKDKLRYNEYFDMQSIFDELYQQSRNNNNFYKLMEVIGSKQNIRLAYRNLKGNTGSKTKGTDGKTIEDISKLNDDMLIKEVRARLEDYKPLPVRRVYIPKPGSDKKRPLGIPTIWDRLIQQCILQVLEPICEPKFHNHSYGFRPNRSTHHAVSRMVSLINLGRHYYCVDIDIKGFFDNVNHGKLMKQIWNLGIRDKRLLCIISKLLKCEIEGEGIPTKGTPQGGILSPLLSNIVLNELDWWISSQWESFQTDHDYTSIRKNGYVDQSNKYKTMKTTNLKEIWLVRYADDFKIFCRDYETANKIYIATKQWLKERLSLEISEDKSKITNLKTNYTEFLGFKLMAKPKKGKYVCQSRISEKAQDSVTTKLKHQIVYMRSNYESKQVNKLNAMILGVHNYYKIATNVSLDFNKINYLTSITLHNRLKQVISDKPSTSKAFKKFYGKYKGKIRTISNVSIYPINGISTSPPMNFTQEICNYTVTGRALVHKKLNNDYHLLVRYLLNNVRDCESTEYSDNRISLMIAQKGNCGVTGEPLNVCDMQCHHKLPKSQGGTDAYKNLIWVNEDIHKLIHATKEETINKYLHKLKLNEKSLEKLNSLREQVGNLTI